MIVYIGYFLLRLQGGTRPRTKVQLSSAAFPSGCNAKCKIRNSVQTVRRDFVENLKSAKHFSVQRRMPAKRARERLYLSSAVWYNAGNDKSKAERAESPCALFLWEGTGADRCARDSCNKHNACSIVFVLWSEISAEYQTWTGTGKSHGSSTGKEYTRLLVFHSVLHCDTCACFSARGLFRWKAKTGFFGNVVRIGFGSVVVEFRFGFQLGTWNFRRLLHTHRRFRQKETVPLRRNGDKETEQGHRKSIRERQVQILHTLFVS